MSFESLERMLCYFPLTVFERSRVESLHSRCRSEGKGKERCLLMFFRVILDLLTPFRRHDLFAHNSGGCRGQSNNVLLVSHHDFAFYPPLSSNHSFFFPCLAESSSKYCPVCWGMLGAWLPFLGTRLVNHLMFFAAVSCFTLG